MTTVNLTQPQADFINALHKKFGKDASLKPKEILEFAKTLGIKRPNWFFVKGVGKKVGFARWEVPTNVTVVASTRKPRAVKAKAKVKATVAKKAPAAATKKPMAHVDMKAVVTKAAAELESEKAQEAIEKAMA
jgi:hypothetical protein